MSEVDGILGQVAPGAATLVTAYQVPAGKHAKIKVIVTNRGAADKFRIAVSPGSAIADKHYLAYDEDIEANDSLVSAEFLVSSRDAGEKDLVRVRSLNGSLSFNVTGIEEDNERHSARS